MSSRSGIRTDAPIKVSVSCLADYVSSGSHSPESKLRPYKFNKRGEGFARSSYYPMAIAAIRQYHDSGNDPKVLQEASLELSKRADETQKKWERTKLAKNVDAIQAYQKVYRNRNFKVLPNHRISYRLGPLIITAQPDLWVQENGTQVLLKIGIAKKKTSYVDVLLTMMRKAAVSSKYPVRARNIVYLNVTTGAEMVCSGGLTRFNRTFAAAAREIASVWPNVTPTTTSTSSVS